ncbi:MAG: hypothetical protein A3F11_10890 [Gammaproteobacteria bacterium RIFCSPHIGHO2_12_FULL_37_14]|nr:MAG: hypothetical protein A3F11_10890 [Gammaproteobacteria bacterium RIFCSPHIGHO2_12_FULL_37_14]
MFLALIINPGKYLNYLPFNHFLHKEELIFFSGSLIILSLLLKAIFNSFVQMQVVSTGFKFNLSLKIRLIHTFQYAPYIYHINQSSSSLLARMGYIDTFTGSILLPSLSIASNLMITFGITCFLIVLNPISTALLITLCGVFIGINNGLLKEKIKKMGKIFTDGSATIIKNIQHSISGIKEIRIFGKEQYFLSRIEASAIVCGKASETNALYQTLPRYTIESALSIFIILLCLGSLFFGMKPENIISFVGVFAAAGARLLPTMTQLTAGINQIRFSAHSMDKVYHELKVLEQIKSAAIPKASSNKIQFSTISLQNLSFHYPNRKIHALRNINLTFHKGQSVGIIGASGAGKSTLINVLLGFLEPQEGKILIDEQAITNMREWTNNFAYIPQEIFLLDDTIKNNIALGIEESEIDQDQLEKAIQMARLDQVINELPEGIETLIGEKGIRLSGGQRQRVALARAFYHDREIVVLDEATSSLDNETEREIIHSTKCLQKVKTLIVIAHRLTTVQHCNIIFKLSQGEIIQSGSFQEVIGRNMLTA